MKLPLADFKKVVKNTPLVSIDLIVRNSKGDVLLGQRTNRPAKGFWFVPGGRVLKGEPFENAFKRLIKEELGAQASEPTFIGVYQHFYDDNFSEDDFSTHYIVLAYEVIFAGKLDALPFEQHANYRWFSENELLLNEKVHRHTKWYFQENKQVDTLKNKREVES